jgi:O-antigen ligase
MIFGLASVWRLLGILETARGKQRLKQLVVHCTLVATALWLLRTADAMTSFACFVLAGGVIVWASRPVIGRKPVFIHAAVFSMLAVAFSALFLNVNSGLVENLGRNSSLTGRTEIWTLVTSMIPNRLVGAGFESYWVGERLQKIWSVYWNHPNQAHNGYLEIYLNLGWLGIATVAAMILGGYRSIMYAVRRRSPESTLRLGCFVAALIYNFTESAFKMTHPVWITFLTAITFMPEVGPRAQSETASESYELLAEADAGATIYAEEAV